MAQSDTTDRKLEIPNLEEEVLTASDNLSLIEAENITTIARQIAATITSQSYDQIQECISLYNQAIDIYELSLEHSEIALSLKKELCVVFAKQVFIRVEQQTEITLEFIESIREDACLLFDLMCELDSPTQTESLNYIPEPTPLPHYILEASNKGIDAQVCLILASLIYQRVREDQIELDSNQKSSLETIEAAQNSSELACLKWMNKYFTDNIDIPLLASNNFQSADQLVGIAVQLFVDIINLLNFKQNDADNEQNLAIYDSLDIPGPEVITKILQSLSAHPACLANEAAMHILNPKQLATKPAYTPSYAAAYKAATYIIPLVGLTLPVLFACAKSINLRSKMQ